MAGRTAGADSDEELTLVFDLTIYTAKVGRSRAIDRYAKTAQLSSNSVSDARCHAPRTVLDLTDAEWAILCPFLPTEADCGRKRAWPMREIVNAICYVLRSGIA